ncbi:MAG: hypothetical protein HYR91_13890 [Flavobacteriia bacterium]|nr:hypothetical protein [Flavobacteriia bacterium]
MKKTILFLYLILTLGSCGDRCNLSKPEPSKIEKEYFYFLNKKYNCIVDRTINDNILINDVDRKCSYYSVVLRMNHNSEFKEEKIFEIGKEIAEHLHKEILKNNHEYAYNEIVVGFDSDTQNQIEYIYDYKNFILN